MSEVVSMSWDGEGGDAGGTSFRVAGHGPGLVTGRCLFGTAAGVPRCEVLMLRGGGGVAVRGGRVAVTVANITHIGTRGCCCCPIDVGRMISGAGSEDCEPDEGLRRGLSINCSWTVSNAALMTLEECGTFVYLESSDVHHVCSLHQMKSMGSVIQHRSTKITSLHLREERKRSTLLCHLEGCCRCFEGVRQHPAIKIVALGLIGLIGAGHNILVRAPN